MFTLRCTQRLLDRVKATPDPAPTPADTILGDWYANLIRFGRTQIVIAVSERTLLPIVIPAKGARTLPTRLGDTLEHLLISIGVTPQDALTERSAMLSWSIGKTASRRVLGSLNELAFQLDAGLIHFPERDLLEHALWLARTPLKAIEYGSPDAATVAAFTANREIQRARLAAGS